MENHQEKSRTSLTRALINAILSVVFIFMLIFLSLTVAAIYALHFSDQDIVKTVEYCHANGFDTVTHYSSQGKVIGVQCDPSMPWRE